MKGVKIEELNYIFSQFVQSDHCSNIMSRVIGTNHGILVPYLLCIIYYIGIICILFLGSVFSV